jgi:phosphosulfolactate synthase (CoM biosynthesis protein A)
MSRISPNAHEESVSPLSQTVEAHTQQLIQTPMLLAGVNRKINTGNYENIDVYCAVSVPLNLVPNGDVEAFHQALRLAAAEAAEVAFGITSKETASRYSLIKEMQRGGRQAAPASGKNATV